MRSSPKSDEDLLLLVHDGDQIAFKELFDRYFKRLFTLAITMMNDEDETMDVVQDVFTHIWVKRETMVIPENVSGYLLRMTRNEAVTHLRRQHPNQSLEILEGSPEHQVLQPEMPQATELTRALGEAIRACLATLRKTFRKQYYAIVLGWRPKLTDEVIARRLNTSRANVAKLRERGRLRVLKCIVAKSKRRGFDLPEYRLL